MHSASNPLNWTVPASPHPSGAALLALAGVIYALAYAGYGFGPNSTVQDLRYLAYALPFSLWLAWTFGGPMHVNTAAVCYLVAYLLMTGLSLLAGPGMRQPFWSDFISTTLILALFVPRLNVQLWHLRLVLILTAVLFALSFILSESKDIRLLHILSSAAGAASEEGFDNDAGGLVGPVLAVFFYAIGARLEFVTALAISIVGGKRIAIVAIVIALVAFYVVTRMPVLRSNRARFIALLLALSAINVVSCNLQAVSETAYHLLRPDAAMEQIMLGRYAITAEMTRLIAERPTTEWLLGTGPGSARSLATLVTDGTLTLPHNDWLKLHFDLGVVGSVLGTVLMAGVFCSSPLSFCLALGVGVMMMTDNVAIYIYYQFLLALFIAYGARYPAAATSSSVEQRTQITGAPSASTLAGVCGLLLVACQLIAARPSHAADAADLFVSTDGRDDWSGRLPAPNASGSDGPLATLENALHRVAALRRSEPHRERPIVVGVRGGTYYLTRPLKLTPRDSGTEQAPTVIAAVGGERPIISGGVRILGWTTTIDGRWQARLPDVRSGAWSFAQLFVDDQRRYRPRLPARGYYRTAADLGRNQMGVAPGDVSPQWARSADIEVLAFHDWSATRRHLVSVSPGDGRLIVDGRAWTDVPPGSRYLLDNVPGAMSTPGQWYLDRAAGLLTYLPMSGEQPERTDVVAPRLANLVVLQGNPRQKRWVEHVVFRGLTFAHANWTLPPHGQSFPQAEVGVDTAIVGIGARNVRFQGIAVRHVGGYAIGFGAGSQGNRLEDCELADLGAGGVKIGVAGAATWASSMLLPDSPEMVVSGNVVRNCLIAHGGRLHPAGMGIWIGQSPDNVIEHNTIRDFYQSGISVGWTWGFGDSRAHGNDIGRNEIDTIGQGVMSDMAGIYTLGTQRGTRVHDNIVHDVRAFRYGAWGLYADEGSSDIAFERNIVHHTGSAGFFQHFGRRNIVRGNIFAFAADIQVELARGERSDDVTFERNIVYWSGAGSLVGGCFIASDPCPVSFTFDDNLYWNTSGNVSLFPHNADIPEWRRRYGQDARSVVADPGFVNAEAGDFSFSGISAATDIGFDVSSAATAAGRLSPPCLLSRLPPVPPGFE